jgi:hypothetical protein
VKTYYQDEFVTLYHADCREWVAPTYAWLLLTDPPYGIGYSTEYKNYKDGVDHRAIQGDAAPFDPTHLLRYPQAIIWGGNNFASRLPDSGKWLAWVKTARDDANIRQADMELAWTNCVTRPRVFHHLWIGAYKASESGQRAQHPTQKPIALMQWCIGLVPSAQTIFDPYAGAGTTLRAAKELGLRSIGIEIDERYCEIAAERCRQEILFGEVA